MQWLPPGYEHVLDTKRQVFNTQFLQHVLFHHVDHCSLGFIFKNPGTHYLGSHQRGILKERQKELEDILNGKLHGVQRVPALPFHDNPTEE